MVINLILELFRKDGTSGLEITLMIITLTLTLALVRFIYTIRVYSGLIEVYGVKRRWMWLCLLGYTRWIPTLIWGFHKSYQPAWQVEDSEAGAGGR